MKKRFIILNVIFLIFMLISNNGFCARAKIGIPPFENKAGVDEKIANGFVDMLVTAFVKARKFEVIERSSLKKIVEEQSFGASGAIDPSSAAQIGKMAGVQYIVVGIITQCGLAKKGTQAFGIGVKQSIAQMGVDIRLVDTTTGSIKLAETFSKSKTATGFSGSGVNFNLTSGPVSDLARQICSEVVSMVMFAVYPPKILKVTDKKVTINYGNSMLSNGDMYEVFLLGEEMIDPDTGESLGADEEHMGQIKITRTTAKFSTGSVLNSSGPIELGMVLRPIVKEKKEKKKISVPW